MKRRNPDAPTYEILMAIRSCQKIDGLFGQQLNLQSGRKHAYVASRNKAAALRGLKKLEGMK